MDQSRAPVLDALIAYRRRGALPFTPPGHKQGRGVDPRVLTVLGGGIFQADVMVFNGLDDRLLTNGILEEAQQLMAEAVNAEQAVFSTCGSSLAVKSAMLSVAGPGEKLVVARDAHKSVVAGLILGGIEPVWVRPVWDAELHLSCPPTPAAVEAALQAEPDAKGVLISSPTDYGTCADLAGIKQVCARHDRAFIVDEAWGAHLPFHPQELPAWGMNAGADICVTSVHKMGSGLGQGSVLHIRGDRVDPDVLKSREDLLGTTGPSTPIYASIDGWRRHMVEQGKELLDRAINLAMSVRAVINQIGGLRVMDRKMCTGFALDPLKLVIDVSGLGADGYHAADWLRERAHVNMALSDHRRIAAQITIGDDAETTGVLIESLRAMVAAGDLPAASKIDLPEPDGLELETVMRPRDAFFGPAEQVPIEKAIGRVSAEMVTPYPPGVPVLAPGERITSAALRYLSTGLAAGMCIPDASDPALRTLRVVA